MNSTIRTANTRYESAAKALVRACEVSVPVGTTIKVTIGKSVVRGKVVSSSGCWWSNPGQMVVENERTGKHRSFNAPTSDALIQS